MMRGALSIAQDARHGDLPFALCADAVAWLQMCKIGVHVSSIPCAQSACAQPFEIAGRVVHVGFLTST